VNWIELWSKFAKQLTKSSKSFSAQIKKSWSSFLSSYPFWAHRVIYELLKTPSQQFLSSSQYLSSLVFFCGVTVWGDLISSQRPFEGLQISSPPQKSLKQKEKLIFFSTHVLSLNLYENFMGIAVLYFASLCLFFRTFFEVFKINFVTKSVKVQI
jgi:hypothetical protein